jgi:hypothetical protein
MLLTLDDWTNNKAIQKIKESLRISYKKKENSINLENNNIGKNLA